jgi:outer membrane protein assembly factor BamB
MRHSTTLAELLATIASRRAFLTRSVVLGAALPGLGSVLAACGGDDDDDAEYPAVGALRLADGAVEWSVRSPDEAYRTVIGANDAVVLIDETRVWRGERTGSRRTIAFDAADGSERWRRATGDAPTPPGPVDGQGIVVLADQDARALVGVDVLTGAEHWRVASHEAPLANSPTVAVVWNVTSPGTPSGFRGIDRLTGDERWVSDTLLLDQSGNVVARSPAAVLDEVLVVPTGATVTALDMRTGALRWQAPQLDHPDAADGIVVGTRGTTVTAIDAASGQERWTAPGRASYGDLLAVGDGVLVVMDPGGPELIAYALSSGNERWRAKLTTYRAGQVSFEPRLISGTSLVMLWEGEIAVLSTTDGTTLWSATQPFGSSQMKVVMILSMNSVGSNGDSVFVAINSRRWTD